MGTRNWSLAPLSWASDVKGSTFLSFDIVDLRLLGWLFGYWTRRTWIEEREKGWWWCPRRRREHVERTCTSTRPCFVFSPSWIFHILLSLSPVRPIQLSSWVYRHDTSKQSIHYFIFHYFIFWILDMCDRSLFVVFHSSIPYHSSFLPFYSIHPFTSPSIIISNLLLFSRRGGSECGGRKWEIGTGSVSLNTRYLFVIWDNPLLSIGYT